MKKKQKQKKRHKKNPVQGTFWKVPKTGLDALCLGRPISVARCAAAVRSLDSLPQRAANRIFPLCDLLYDAESTDA